MLNSDAVVSRTHGNYGDCKVLLFYCPTYFTRAWCCLEIAICTSQGCELVVLGSCHDVQVKDFFNEMRASVITDMVLIRKGINDAFGDANNFNCIISRAMMSLCVASSKNIPCNLFGNIPRHKRGEWRSMLVPEQYPVRCRDRNDDWEILTGRPASDADLAGESRCIRVFLSSTLTDTMLERNFIASDVEPYLKLCARSYGLDFMFSDMRKGTHEDVDTLPPKVVLKELHNCQMVSAGLNYVLMLGNKYGSQPLPNDIPQQEFDDLVTCFVREDAKQIAKDWYGLDENVLDAGGMPRPKYVLKDCHKRRDSRKSRLMLQGEFRAAALSKWADVDIMGVRKRTIHVAGSSEDGIESYFVSSVDMEAGRGILAPDNLGEGNRSFAFSRQFVWETEEEVCQSPAMGAFFDTSDGRLDTDAGRNLRELQEDVIGPALVKRDCSITKYKVRLQTIGIDPEDVGHATYMRAFLDNLARVGVSTIKDVARRLAVKPDPLVDEVRHHLKFCADRANRFHHSKSSSSALNQVKQYLDGPGGRAFVVWGPSGGGKTYVMAKAAHERSKTGTEAILIRFLGASSKSSDVFHLLESVCENLRIISHGESAFKNGGEGVGLPVCPKSFQDLRVYLSDALTNWKYGPLTIFVDSLDRLDTLNSGLSLAWLPVLGLSEQVHLVISTLPDEQNPDVGTPFRCLSILCMKLVPNFIPLSGLTQQEKFTKVSKEHPQLFVRVEPLEDAGPLLSHLLKLSGRRASKRQVANVVDLVMGSDRTQTPLLVTMFADIVSKLHSFDEVPMFGAGREITSLSVRQIIVNYCHQLQLGHGKRLVAHSLSYMTIPLQGITEDELMDILSIDDLVLAEAYPWLVSHKWHMPSAPVTLLLSELDPFLSRRAHRSGGELLSWCHRQFWEAVEDHFLSGKRLNNIEFELERLQTLREFFLGLWAKKPKDLSPELLARVKHFRKGETSSLRSVRDQPLQLRGKGKWHAEAVYNTRRCVELMPILITEIKCRVLQMHSKTGDNHDNVAKLAQALKVAELEVCTVDGVVARSMVGEKFRFLSQCKVFLGYVAATMKMPQVRKVLGSLSIDTECIKHFCKWIRRDALDFESPGQIIASLLRQPAASKARTQYVSNKTRTSVEWIQHAVHTNTSSKFDDVLAILKGHNASINSVVWSPGNGDQIASCADDKTVILWDSQTGEQVFKLAGHNDYVLCVAWSPNGQQIASGCGNPDGIGGQNEIIIWDGTTGEQVLTLKGHGGAVISVAWSPNGAEIASGSADNTIIIWDAKSGKQGSTLKGHSKWVQSVAWDPNGDRIASGSRDRTIMVWDVKALAGDPFGIIKTGTKKQHESLTGHSGVVSLPFILVGHSATVTSVTWSPNGDRIASGSDDKTIIIWDSKTGHQVSTIEKSSGASTVKSVAWSPIGDRIASGYDNKNIIIWELKAGEQATSTTLCKHTECVLSVAWGPNGDQIASASADKTIILWDADRGDPVGTFLWHLGWVESMAWSPNGVQIASSGFSDMTIWDARTGDQVSSLKLTSCWVDSFAWSPDGNQIVAGYHTTGSCEDQYPIIIWDAKTGDQVSTLKGHRSTVKSVAWSPKGDKIASSCSWDKAIIIWDAKSCEKAATIKEFPGHCTCVQSVAWSPCGAQILSLCNSGTIIIWDAMTCIQLLAMNGHPESRGHSSDVKCIAWSPNGDHIASGSNDATAIIWDAKTGCQVSRLQGHSQGLNSLAWSPNSTRIASGSSDKSIIIWDAKTGDQVSTLKGNTDGVLFVGWSPDGDQIASRSGDRSIIIWDAQTGDQAQVSRLKGHTDDVNSVAWSPDGVQVASGSRDKTIMIWDAATGAEVRTLKGHSAPSLRFAQSVARRRSPKRSPKRVRINNKLELGPRVVNRVIWAGDHVPKHTGSTRVVLTVVWSPNGAKITGGSDQTIIIWDTKTGDQISKLCGHTARVASLMWSPMGDKIASGSLDKTIIIWDATTGSQVSTLNGHSNMVHGVVWSPCSARIASGSEDKTIIIWDAKTGHKVLTLNGHTSSVISLAWSPKGDHIASGSDDKTIIIWDATTGHQISTLEGHTDSVKSVAWSPIGDRIASGSGDKTICIWDAKTGCNVSTLQGHTECVLSVGWDPNGDRIASGSVDKTIILWDAKTGDQISTLKGHSMSVHRVTWSPNGDQIASRSSDETIIIWDVRTGGQVSTVKGRSRSVLSVAWSPNSTRIASGSKDKTIIIWDAQTGEQVSTLEGHTDDVSNVAWSPKGDQIASGSRDETIIIWNARSGEQVSTLRCQYQVRSMGWSRCGNNIASGSFDGIIIWDVKTCDQVSSLKGHPSIVNSVAWSPDDARIASGYDDRTIIIWDSKSGDQVLTLNGHSYWVQSVAWSPNGQQIASGCGNPYSTRGQNEVIIWNAKKGGRVSTLKGHGGAVMSVAWSPNGDKVASGSRDKTIIIWDAKSGKQAATLEGHSFEINSISWSPKDDQIAFGSSAITVWEHWEVKTTQQVLNHVGLPEYDDPEESEEVKNLSLNQASCSCSLFRKRRKPEGHHGPVYSVAWNSNGHRIASGSGDKTIIIWDTKNGKILSTLKGHSHDVNCVAWSPNGAQIASGSADDTIIIWDAKRGGKVSILHGHAGAVYCVAWSPIGVRIASGSCDRTVVIWDAKTGDQISMLKGHSSRINSVAWSPIGDHIASGSDDKTIIIWDAKTEQQLSTITGHTNKVNSVAWKPRGDQIVSCCGNRYDATGCDEVIIWDVKTGDQVSVLKGHGAGVKSVAWSPQGDHVASGSTDRTIIIWDAKTGN